MARNLIISDNHEHPELAEQLMAKVSHDACYSQGDWFDDYGSDINKLERTAHWLRDMGKSIKKCFGNHDMPYAYGHFYTPGYTKTRGGAVRRILRTSFWDDWKLHYWVDGWLVAHAGVHPYLLQRVPPEAYREMIDHCCKDALNAMHNGMRHFMLGWGADRGGDEQRIGGINWLDWNSLQAIPGLNQLVGHTYCKEGIRSKITAESQNYCIDAGFRYFAVITDGKLEIFKTEDFIGRWTRKKAS